MCLFCAVRHHSLCVVVLSHCWHPDRLCCCNISRSLDRVLCSLCPSTCSLSFFHCFSLCSLISPQQGPNTCMSHYKRLWASEHGLCWRLVYSRKYTKGRFRDSKHCCARHDVHDDRSDSSGFQASRRLSTLSVPVGSQTVFFKFSNCMLDFWVFASTSPRRACKDHLDLKEFGEFSTVCGSGIASDVSSACMSATAEVGATRSTMGAGETNSATTKRASKANATPNLGGADYAGRSRPNCKSWISAISFTVCHCGLLVSSLAWLTFWSMPPEMPGLFVRIVASQASLAHAAAVVDDGRSGISPVFSTACGSKSVSSKTMDTCWMSGISPMFSTVGSRASSPKPKEGSPQPPTSRICLSPGPSGHHGSQRISSRPASVLAPRAPRERLGGTPHQLQESLQPPHTRKTVCPAPSGHQGFQRMSWRPATAGARWFLHDLHLCCGKCNFGKRLDLWVFGDFCHGLWNHVQCCYALDTRDSRHVLQDRSRMDVLCINRVSFPNGCRVERVSELCVPQTTCRW